MTEQFVDFLGLLLGPPEVGADAGKGLHHFRDRTLRLATGGREMPRPNRENPSAKRDFCLRCVGHAGQVSMFWHPDNWSIWSHGSAK
jgi:hypothetical protein